MEALQEQQLEDLANACPEDEVIELEYEEMAAGAYNPPENAATDSPPMLTPTPRIFELGSCKWLLPYYVDHILGARRPPSHCSKLVLKYMHW